MLGFLAKHVQEHFVSHLVLDDAIERSLLVPRRIGDGGKEKCLPYLTFTLRIGEISRLFALQPTRNGVLNFRV